MKMKYSYSYHSDKCDKLLKKANELKDKEEYEAALENYCSAIKELEQNGAGSQAMARTHMRIGRCYEQLKNYGKAIDSYAKGLLILKKPDGTKAHRLEHAFFERIGESNKKSGFYERAALAYQSAISTINTDFTYAYLTKITLCGKLSSCFFLMKEYDEVIESITNNIKGSNPFYFICANTLAKIAELKQSILGDIASYRNDFHKMRSNVSSPKLGSPWPKSPTMSDTSPCNNELAPKDLSFKLEQIANIAKNNSKKC